MQADDPVIADVAVALQELHGRGQSVSRRLREQRRPRNRTDDPVDSQPELSLEVLDRGRRLRAEVAVDADRYTIDPEQELQVGDGVAVGTRRDGGGRAGRLREHSGASSVAEVGERRRYLDEPNRVRRDTTGRNWSVTAGLSGAWD